MSQSYRATRDKTAVASPCFSEASQTAARQDQSKCGCSVFSRRLPILIVASVLLLDILQNGCAEYPSSHFQPKRSHAHLLSHDRGTKNLTNPWTRPDFLLSRRMPHSGSSGESIRAADSVACSAFRAGNASIRLTSPPLTFRLPCAGRRSSSSADARDGSAFRRLRKSHRSSLT